ncbi:hypothetical protein [Pseudomonas cavernicola]|uniref:hypothetical protein n=1 Tax=Pseudomonas cavernicola TaxID=2320866 RepID=UPI0011C42F14|nr:hypothetical protein [Pseudomonas cavernicola]
MKSIFSVTAFSGLLVALAATTSGQATSAPLPSFEQEPAYLLAENGSDRLLQYRMLNNDVAQARAREDESQRFTQLLEEQPTAAGPQVEPDDAQPIKGPAPQYKSLIHQQRIEYGH